jgi:hypothetical protein
MEYAVISVLWELPWWGGYVGVFCGLRACEKIQVWQVDAKQNDRQRPKRS